MRGTYDNLYNRTRTRIDGRNQADPAVQAGMRKIHRGMDGSVIGGVTAEGAAIGTKAGGGSLGGGLSRWERLNPNAKPAFSAGSPANSKSVNRRMLRDQARPVSGGNLASRFVDAAMPKPSVPSMVPTMAKSDTVASKARAVGGWKKPPLMASR